MCMMVYIASDYPLPTLPWDGNRPGFHVIDLPERDNAIRGRFSKPHVYYAGSHERCGCGFQYGYYPEVDEDDQRRAAVAKVSRSSLVSFLKVALQHQQAVELYSCWDGDHAAPAEFTGKVRPEDLVRDKTFFLEKEFLLITEGSV